MTVKAKTLRNDHTSSIINSFKKNWMYCVCVYYVWICEKWVNVWRTHDCMTIKWYVNSIHLNKIVITIYLFIFFVILVNFMPWLIYFVLRVFERKRVAIVINCWTLKNWFETIRLLFLVIFIHSQMTIN